MPVQIACPNPDCDSTYSVADENLGKLARCKKCGKQFPLVPGTRAHVEPSASQADLEPAEPSSQANLPESFGRYQVVRLLGKGGMGSVYLALDTQLNRQVALKVPHLHAFTDRPEVRKRFFVEAQAAARFHHPNFCPIFDIGEQAGVPYLTMAFIEGKTLADSIEHAKGWPPRKAAEVVRELALALAKAHREGIIHRDLKPANIMIDSDGRMILMDFGLARWYEDLDSTLTPTGAILGTPTYMPPEQAESKFHAVGPRSDLYSLGVILYELLTGRRPFDGPIGVVFGKVLFTEPDPPSSHQAGIDPRLEAICLKAMAKKPENRQASMEEFAGALAEFLKVPAIAKSVEPQPARKANSKRNLRPLPPPEPRPAPPGSNPTSPGTPIRKFFTSASAFSWFILGIIYKILVAILITILALVGLIFGIIYFTSDETQKATEAKNQSPTVGGAPVPKPTVETNPPVDDTPITNTIGMKLKLIPAGEFMMGAADGEPEAEAGETPQHKVRISKPFYLGVYEVTQAEYKEVIGTNPSYFSATGGGKTRVAGLDTGRFPVELVSWLDAIAFCNRLSERESLGPCYTESGEPIATGTGYRLPTEAEWEYACRAGTTATFSFGAMLTTADANFDGNFTYNGSPKGKYLKRTVLVGSYRPNAFGLYDMHGNAWEWCQDRYKIGYYATLPDPAVDPQNSSQAEGWVLRGGAWSGSPKFCRSAHRSGYPSTYRDNYLGFRVVRIRSDR